MNGIIKLQIGEKMKIPIVIKIRVWIGMLIYNIAGTNKGDKSWKQIPRYKKFCWWLASKIIN